MVLKTFNVDGKHYKQFHSFCKETGLSMSKQVDIFMASVIEENPTKKEDYLRKIRRLQDAEEIINKKKSSKELERLFKKAEKLIPKYNLTAEQMDELVENEILR